MTYFADLTRYAYGGTTDSDDLNVGWLAAGRPFPTSPPTRVLVAALLQCCRQPVRLYRGFHQCEFCDHGLEMPTISFERRRIHLGNGEIRVVGHDHCWYAAPTLVAHYVATHHYAPPAVFCEAVVEAARRLPTIDATSFSALADMSPAQRFGFCLDMLGTANAAAAHPWGQRTLAFLVAAAPAISPERWNDMRPQLDALLDATVLPADPTTRPPTGLHDATRSAMQMLFLARFPASVEEETLELAATVVEALLGSPGDFSENLSRLTRRCN